MKPPALTEVPALTDEQRALVIAYFVANPDGGYKSALAHAGINARKAAAKAAILADDDLADHVHRCLGVDEASLLRRIGEMSADTSHKDRLRATTFALSALHGYREKSETAHTGPDGGPIEVSTDAIDRGIESLLAGLARGRETAAALDATPAALEPGSETGTAAA